VVNIDVSEIVGTSEIADVAGVKPMTVVRWSLRYPGAFPAPVLTLAGGRLWDRREIYAWLADTGRTNEKGPS